jgi:hypothetical protein
MPWLFIKDIIKTKCRQYQHGRNCVQGESNLCFFDFLINKCDGFQTLPIGMERVMGVEPTWLAWKAKKDPKCHFLNETE